MVRVLRDAGCIAIAYEEMTDDNGARIVREVRDGSFRAAASVS